MLHLANDGRYVTRPQGTAEAIGSTSPPSLLRADEVIE